MLVTVQGLNWRVKKYLGKALTLVKYIAFNHLKVGYPETSQSNKFEVFGEFDVEEKTVISIPKFQLAFPNTCLCVLAVYSTLLLSKLIM